MAGQYHRSLDTSQSQAGQQGLPWFIASHEPDWKLVDAANPCNRLPTLSPRELPAEPFKDLYYYRQQDADIFFGRCRDTLVILHLLEQSEPLILLHGGTGVGKSSFLQAGLIPRLEARGQTVHTFRYSDIDPQQNLNAQVFQADDIASVRKRLLDAPLSLPEIWIIDQLEEIFLYDGDAPAQIIPARLHTLLDSLHALLYPAEGHIKIILSLRKDWFSELNEACKQYRLGYYEYFLRPLDKAAIIEAIESPARLPRLYDKYQLTIHNPADGRLAEQIADDLLRDAGSSIAPTLQIILYQLWQQVKNRSPDQRIWDQALYLQQEVKGLEDHLQRQLADIASLHHHEFGAWGKAAYVSGLLLDVLYAHTSKPHHTAAPLTREQYDQLYPHIPYRHALLKALTDHHLLIDPQQDDSSNERGKHQTRMAHDTLAQLVGLLYINSEQPGPRAREILNYYKAEWKKDAMGKIKGPLLAERDLAAFDRGEAGTKDWRQDEVEKLLVEKSRRNSLVNKLMRYLVIIIFSFSIVFFMYEVMKVLPSITIEKNLDNYYLLKNEFEKNNQIIDDRIMSFILESQTDIKSTNDLFLNMIDEINKYSLDII